jgi:hypothetical protein
MTVDVSCNTIIVSLTDEFCPTAYLSPFTRLQIPLSTCFHITAVEHCAFSVAFSAAGQCAWRHCRLHAYVKNFLRKSIGSFQTLLVFFIIVSSSIFWRFNCSFLIYCCSSVGIWVALHISENAIKLILLLYVFIDCNVGEHFVCEENVYQWRRCCQTYTVWLWRYSIVAFIMPSAVDAYCAYITEMSSVVMQVECVHTCINKSFFS